MRVLTHSPVSLRKKLIAATRIRPSGALNEKNEYFLVCFFCKVRTISEEIQLILGFNGGRMHGTTAMDRT